MTELAAANPIEVKNEVFYLSTKLLAVPLICLHHQASKMAGHLAQMRMYGMFLYRDSI